MSRAGSTAITFAPRGIARGGGPQRHGAVGDQPVGRAQVDAELAVPRLLVDLVDLAGLEDAGVVEEHVEALVAGDHAFHERLDLGAARHVAARGARELEAAAAQRGRRGLPRLAVQVGDHDGGSLREQPLRRRQPDARGAAGDQGDPALEPAAARVLRVHLEPPLSHYYRPPAVARTSARVSADLDLLASPYVANGERQRAILRQTQRPGIARAPAGVQVRPQEPIHRAGRRHALRAELPRERLGRRTASRRRSMDYNYDYDVNDGALGALFAVYLIFMIAIYVVTVVGLWKMYVKAGRPGWAAIIPIYNWWVWVEMIGRPRWWFWALVASVLLSWIPIVGVILGILMFVLYLMGCLDMAKAFGRGAGTGIGLWLLPFVFAPILGFGDAQYLGPVASPAGGGFGAAPPPPPAGGYGLPPTPPAPPAPPSAPVTPAQAGIPAAPVTPPVTPATAAPAAPVTPPATAAVPEPPTVPAEAPATAEVSPAAPDTGTAATDVNQTAPADEPEAPEAPPAPPASSPPPPPPLV